MQVDAAQQDRLLRFAAVVREALAASGTPAALIARSGTDLSRFGLRYSHAAVALAEGLDMPWAVRQLYYDCVERQPRLFDQGLAGFVVGSDNPRIGFVRLLLLPPEAAAPLAAAALDRPLALGLLNARYSANAYPFSTLYQNCNQWVAELLAAAWAGRRERDEAQAWLRAEGYAPEPVRAAPWLMLAGRFVPWLHFHDHPDDLLNAGQVQTSLPDSLDAFAVQRWPMARRIELCHGPQGIVQREGGAPLADGCVPGPGDRRWAWD
ncbi:MAG: DUF2145 domain-containing protein [Burkholderiales bacterium]|nr:MAG: DUF2145 domain-containing protein [Burkholderiales bacterium]